MRGSKASARKENDQARRKLGNCQKRRLRQSQACWAFMLTEEEQRSICTYTREGHIVEPPMTTGLGISDRQAGILISAGTEADVA